MVLKRNIIYVINKLYCRVGDHHSDCTVSVSRLRWANDKYLIASEALTYAITVKHNELIIAGIDVHDNRSEPRNNLARYTSERLILYA